MSPLLWLCSVEVAVGAGVRHHGQKGGNSHRLYRASNWRDLTVDSVTAASLTAVRDRPKLRRETVGSV